MWAPTTLSGWLSVIVSALLVQAALVHSFPPWAPSLADSVKEKPAASDNSGFPSLPFSGLGSKSLEDALKRPINNPMNYMAIGRVFIPEVSITSHVKNFFAKRQINVLYTIFFGYR